MLHGESISISAGARCIACGYSLTGLPVARCPECGGTFDPANNLSYRTPSDNPLRVIWRRHHRRIVNAFVAAACIAASWGMYLYGFSLFFWVPTVALLMRRQWLAFLLLLGLNPFTVLFVEECRQYARGGVMYVRPTFTDIETPQGSDKASTRLRGFDPGCGTRSENYWVRSSAIDLAKGVMHRMTGPPPGAYTGPYPTLEQCLQVLQKQGEAQPRKMLDSSSIMLAAKRYTIQTNDIFRWGYVVNQPDPAPVTAAMFQSRCLVVRIPRDQNPLLASIKLFDATTGRPFATYLVDAHNKSAW